MSKLISKYVMWTDFRFTHISKFMFMFPHPQSQGEHIGFGVDPIGVCVALFPCFIFWTSEWIMTKLS